MSLKQTRSGALKCTCFLVNNQVAEDKCRNIQNVLVSQFYYKVGKNKGYNFFQSVWEAAILHIAFLYSWADRKKWLPYFLAVEMKKMMMCEKNNQWWCWGLHKEISGSFSDYSSHARQSLAWDWIIWKLAWDFPCLGLNTIIDSIKHIQYLFALQITAVYNGMKSCPCVILCKGLSSHCHRFQQYFCHVLAKIRSHVYWQPIQVGSTSAFQRFN